MTTMTLLPVLDGDTHADAMMDAEFLGWFRPGPDSLGYQTADPFAVYAANGRAFRIGRSACGGFIHYPYTGRLGQLHATPK